MFRRCPISILFYREGDVSQALEKRVRKELGKR
jgi:hypothetical protein